MLSSTTLHRAVYVKQNNAEFDKREAVPLAIEKMN